MVHPQIFRANRGIKKQLYQDPPGTLDWGYMAPISRTKGLGISTETASNRQYLKSLRPGCRLIVLAVFCK